MGLGSVSNKDGPEDYAREWTLTATMYLGTHYYVLWKIQYSSAVFNSNSMNTQGDFVLCCSFESQGMF